MENNFMEKLYLKLENTVDGINLFIKDIPAPIHFVSHKDYESTKLHLINWDIDSELEALIIDAVHLGSIPKEFCEIFQILVLQIVRGYSKDKKIYFVDYNKDPETFDEWPYTLILNKRYEKVLVENS